MNLSGVILTVAGMVSVASLPFAMAWVESVLMASSPVKSQQR